MTMKLKRFLVERDIPGIGSMSIVELCGASRASNQAIADMSPKVLWHHSYIADDKAFCIYLADSEASVVKHAELAGLPANKITEVPQIIDPLTANN